MRAVPTLRGVSSKGSLRPSSAKELTVRAPADASPRHSDVQQPRLRSVALRRSGVKSSSRLRDLCSLSSNTSVTQARAAVVTEQTMHSSCSSAHARPLFAMHGTVPVRMPVTSRATAIKVSCSSHAANSLCTGCGERHWLRVEVERHVSVFVVDGSGHAYPQ